MKKMLFFASVLMLALCMSTTSCTNELDKIVEDEQLSELHVLHLSAVVSQRPETRLYMEGTGTDAFKITGWKDGDVILGCYYIPIDGYTGLYNRGALKFTFNGAAQEFVSEPTSITAEEIKFVVYGCNENLQILNSRIEGFAEFYVEADFPSGYFTIDSDDNYAEIPLMGIASVSGDKLTADLRFPEGLALLCVHNNSTEQINISLLHHCAPGLLSPEPWDLYRKSFYLTLDPHKDCLIVSGQSLTEDENSALKVVIAPGEKAYLPIQHNVPEASLCICVNGVQFGDAKTENLIVEGKVYSIYYPTK